MVVRRGPFSRVDKVAAWICAGVCVGGGGIGIALVATYADWRLGLAALAAIALGVFFARAAWKGRPY